MIHQPEASKQEASGFYETSVMVECFKFGFGGLTEQSGSG